MQLTITLDGLEKPEVIVRLTTALEGLYDVERPMAALESTGDVFGNRTLHLPPVAEGEREALLAKLEAENPQFGKQPLPEGATALERAHAAIDLSNFPPGSFIVEGSNPPEVHHGPLAPPPPGAPSPAAAEASASAPAATPASIPPPPSAASPAPSPPPAAAIPAPAAAVDAKGLPWDERIHASSRAKIADGSWRMKRGVQSHVVEAVEAELRAQSGTTAPVAAPEPVSPPSPPAPPAAPVAGEGLTFGQLAKRVGAKITLGELTAQDLAAKMAALGFPGGLHEANARPDMWATILETLGA